MTRRPFRKTAVVTAQFLLLVPASLSADPMAWDHEAVAAIARELAEAVKDLRVTVERNPNLPAGAGRRAQYEAREDLRLLQNMTKRLASQLEKGEGHEATRPIYRRVEAIRRDAEEAGRRARIQQNTMAKIEVARELLEKLAPYYDAPYFNAEP